MDYTWFPFYFFLILSSQNFCRSFYPLSTLRCCDLKNFFLLSFPHSPFLFLNSVVIFNSMVHFPWKNLKRLFWPPVSLDWPHMRLASLMLHSTDNWSVSLIDFASKIFYLYFSTFLFYTPHFLYCEAPIRFAFSHLSF